MPLYPVLDQHILGILSGFLITGIQAFSGNCEWDMMFMRQLKIRILEYPK